MSIFSISRRFSFSVVTKDPCFSLTKSAEKYWTHLQKEGSNVERSLNTVRDKLDSSCINDVLKRCSADQNHVLGLRFFIWAGSQPGYRHSSFMYSNACELFRIKENPHIINDIVEAYRFENCVVNVKYFQVVLNLCRDAQLADEGLWVLKKMKEMHCRPDTTAYNVVIRLFCKKGSMDEASELMREMGLIDLYPDLITFLAMIRGFCEMGRLEDACNLFKVAKEQGCSPNVVAYTILLDGFCRFHSLERALELLDEMEKEGGECNPTVVTYTTVIQSFCEKGRSFEALNILDRMEARGCAPSRITLKLLIKGLCMENNVEGAYKLIDRVLASGSVSVGDCYSSLVVSLFGIGKFEEAEKLFRSMLVSEVKPSGFASTVLLRKLCSDHRILDAYQLYQEIDKLSPVSAIDSDIYSILLAGLCEESNAAEATKLAMVMGRRGIRLKALYMDSVIKYLKNRGEMELVSRINCIGHLGD